MSEAKNEIVVYQPNETIRLEVRLDNETVWLSQSQMGLLFGCTTRNVRLHLENIYSSGELLQEATRKDFFLVRQEGTRQVKRNVTCYNLDAIISVGYRVNSILGVKFRQWATGVLKDYLLRGYAFSQRLNLLEDIMERRFAEHDQILIKLKDKVDFFVQTSLPPIQGVFYDGQLEVDVCIPMNAMSGDSFSGEAYSTPLESVRETVLGAPVDMSSFRHIRLLRITRSVPSRTTSMSLYFSNSRIGMSPKIETPFLNASRHFTPSAEQRHSSSPVMTATTLKKSIIPRASR